MTCINCKLPKRCPKCLGLQNIYDFNNRHRTKGLYICNNKVYHKGINICEYKGTKLAFYKDYM